MSHYIPVFELLDARTLPELSSNSVTIIVNTNSEEIFENPINGFEIRRSITPISPSFQVSINLSTRNHDQIATILRDQFIDYHQLCDYLGILISLVACDLGFGYNGFTMTLAVRVTYSKRVWAMANNEGFSSMSSSSSLVAFQISRPVLERVKVEELKSLGSESCSICLENFSGSNPVTRMTCSHLFHENCLSEWLRSKNTCPVCRTVLY